MKLAFFLLLISVGLSGCLAATAYHSSGFTGGYSEQHIEGNVYRIQFGGNSVTTRETVQTYWLYRCAEITLERGFDAFEILPPLRSQINGSPSSVGTTVSNKPWLQGDIRLRKFPFQPVPPGSFNAKRLKVALEQYVWGKKCEVGNVCPHAKPYLEPILLE